MVSSSHSIEPEPKLLCYFSSLQFEQNPVSFEVKPNYVYLVRYQDSLIVHSP